MTIAEPSLPTNPAWLSPRTARWLTPVFLILGVQFWLLLGEGNYGHQNKPLMLLAAIVVGLIPPINRAFNRLWNRIAHPSAAARAWTALFIAIASALFLYWTQRLEQIPCHAPPEHSLVYLIQYLTLQSPRPALMPKWEDEFSYLIQTQMLAAGKLWMPALPMPTYFQTFYVLPAPVYASMYFPGAALMFAPALLLHLPYFVGPLAVAGLCTAFLWLVFTEILDGASATLAVLLLLALPMFRMMSIMLMAQIPTLLLGLIMTWVWLQWRKQSHTRWLLLLGFAAGWGAITRPADALCFAILLGIAIATDLRKKPAIAWINTLAPIAAAAAPFLLFQLFLNHNITGRWFTTPFAQYNDANYPGVFGFPSAPPPEHVSNIREFQLFYDVYAKPVIEQHQWKNFITLGLKSQWEMTRRVAIADPFLWLIMPLSLPVLWNRRFWPIWGMIPVFFILLSFYAFSWVLPHYMVMVIPAVILLAILPIHFLTHTFPNRTGSIRTMISLGIIALALAAMPQFNRFAHDQYFEPLELAHINADLASNVSPPAIVLFHLDLDALRSGTANISEDPVFNPDTAWPLDAKIIRARDLNPTLSSIAKPGDLDRPLYEYYSHADPTRVFYLFNRGVGDKAIKRLGTASELLQTTAPHQP